MANAPFGALAVVLIGWAAGSVAGGFVTAVISRQKHFWPVITLGVLLNLAGIANNLMLPPPIWFWLMTFVVLLPFTLIGSILSPTHWRRPTGNGD